MKFIPSLLTWLALISRPTSNTGDFNDVNTVGPVDCSSFSVTCVITDTVTQEVKSKTVSFTCSGGPQH